MSCAPGGPALETPCGAIRYTQHNPDDTYPTSQGAGKATFALLTRVPTERDLIGLAPLGITLASISAGKHSHHESHSSIVRYTQITPSLILKYESTNFIPHLQLMPLCVDILSRFAKQMEALPHDLEWRENVSCFQHAA